MAQDIFEALRQQLEEKRELQARLQALREERSALFTDARRLDEARLKEQADVTKLEGRSLSGLLHRVTGRLEERLEREQAEARTAAEAHHAAQQKLAAVDGEMERIMTRLDDLRDVEYRYSKAEQEHKAALKAAGGALAAEIESLERSLSATKAQQETNRRILGQIEMCLSGVSEVLGQHNTTEAFAAADALGGSVLTTALKLEQMDEEETAFLHLQQRLKSLRELLPQQQGLELKAQEQRDKGTDALDLLFELIDRSERIGVRRMIRSDVQDLAGRLNSVKVLYSTRQEELDSKYRMFKRRLNDLLHP